MCIFNLICSKSRSFLAFVGFLCLLLFREDQSNKLSAASTEAVQNKKRGRQKTLVFTHSLHAASVDEKRETSNGCSQKRRRRCCERETVNSGEAAAPTACALVTSAVDECAAQLTATSAGLDSSQEPGNELSWSDEIYADTTFDYAK